MESVHVQKIAEPTSEKTPFRLAGECILEKETNYCQEKHKPINPL